MRSLRGALTLLLVAHAMLVAGTQMPKGSVIQSWFDRVATKYMRVTGNWQGWDMFDSAPNYHAFRVELVAKMPGGSTQTFGPLVPGLTEQTRYVRESTFFLRSIDGAYNLYFNGYAQHACAAIHERTGTMPESVFVRQHLERTRAPADVRNDGVIATKQVTDSRSVACGAPR